MPIIVSDTSPIRALNHLGLLNMLGELFDEVLVPPGVLHEVESQISKFGAIELSKYPWVKFRMPGNSEQVAMLLAEVDLGEAQAIALAIELGAEILIDEADGREIARRLGLASVGALGILLRFKQRGLVGKVMPLVDQLQTGLNFYVSKSVREQIKRRAGE